MLFVQCLNYSFSSRPLDLLLELAGFHSRPVAASGCSSVAFAHRASFVNRRLPACCCAPIHGQPDIHDAAAGYAPLQRLRRQPLDRWPRYCLLTFVVALQRFSWARLRHYSGRKLWMLGWVQSPGSFLGPRSCLWTACRRGCPLVLSGGSAVGLAAGWLVVMGGVAGTAGAAQPLIAGVCQGPGSWYSSYSYCPTLV